MTEDERTIYAELLETVKQNEEAYLKNKHIFIQKFLKQRHKDKIDWITIGTVSIKFTNMIDNALYGDESELEL